jgi:hypothetical protein
MRAVKDGLPAPYREVGESEGSRSTAALRPTWGPCHMMEYLYLIYPRDFLLPKTKRELTLARNGFFSEMGGKQTTTHW